MIRTQLVMVALLLGATFSFAQLSPVKLVVGPAAEPVPAFRYELLPHGRERVSGNAVLHYSKALLARPVVDQSKTAEEEKRVAIWEEANVDQLPLAEVKAYLRGYATVFRELEYGTRCKSCEWSFAPASGPAVLDQLISTQPLYRELARTLALRVKLHIAEKRFDDAIADIRTGLQFGKHLGEGPSLIQMLIGHAVTNMFLHRAEQLITVPDAPSLYWALSALPRPFVDPRPGLDGEDALNESFLPGLAELRRGPVTAEKALDTAEKALQVFDVARKNPLAVAASRDAIVNQAESDEKQAKKTLVGRGWDQKVVAVMPAVQAVFLQSFEAYREVADDHRKWFLCPLPESFDGLAKATTKVKQAQKERPRDTFFQTFLLVLPAVEKVHSAGARTERTIALLRAVEAVRLHAEATNVWPKTLSEIKKVPVPTDPLSGLPFEYAATADGFILSAPDAERVPKALAMRYELQVRK